MLKTDEHSRELVAGNRQVRRNKLKGRKYILLRNKFRIVRKSTGRKSTNKASEVKLTSKTLIEKNGYEPFFGKEETCLRKKRNLCGVNFKTLIKKPCTRVNSEEEENGKNVGNSKRHPGLESI